ncbi:MAG: hypothetical protein ACOYN6_09855 [Ignavibacteria bacterium]
MQSLKGYFWDYNFTDEELEKLLSGETEKAGHLDREGLYSRILSSAGWYKIVEIIGLKNMDNALSENVLKRIKSEELKRKLRIAKRILHK